MAGVGGNRRGLGSWDGPGRVIHHLPAVGYPSSGSGRGQAGGLHHQKVRRTHGLAQLHGYSPGSGQILVQDKNLCVTADARSGGVGSHIGTGGDRGGYQGFSLSLSE
jgi:hypothetical protein